MQKTLILTLDYINDIVHPDGKSARYVDRIESNKIIQNANSVIDWGRKKGLPIAHVRVGFSKNYLECPKQSRMFSKIMALGGLKLMGR